MNKAIERDLVDACDALEHLMKKLSDLPLADKIDAAARLRAVVKNAESIDDDVKNAIKEKLKGKAGTVLGDVFKANLTMVESTRFNQTAFKTAEPDLYQQYTETKSAPRITFEAR